MDASGSTRLPLAGEKNGWEELGTAAASLRTTWQCGRFDVSLERPVVMGVLNVTPDSFSDGGEHNEPEEAIAFASKLLAEGADIIDVGGESTRPGAVEVAGREELRRTLPVVRELARKGVCVSIDTRHAQVAAACIEAGASAINDVSGFRDPAMVDVACSCDAGLVVMHMKGDPRSMQQAASYDNVVAEVSSYLRRQALLLEHEGISHSRICIDPGPGFGKKAEHSLALLKATDELASLGWPLMVATSRKGFVGQVTGVRCARERVAGSVASALYAVEHGATVVRVHDVAATVQALRMLQAIQRA
jgi:dihydropteroate synthase